VDIGPYLEIVGHVMGHVGHCNTELYVGNMIQQQIMHSLVKNDWIMALYAGGAQQHHMMH